MDIPLAALVDLRAFGHIHLEGTRVVAFAEEAVKVLYPLFDRNIVRIGDNMRVLSAKDVFLILEE